MDAVYDSEDQQKTQDQQKKVTFQDLPNELILMIFSHLSPEDLACHASQVCLQWLDISKDLVLWNNATLICGSYDSCPLQFKKTILFAPCLAWLKIKMFKCITEDVVQSILSGCASVKCFSFYPGHVMSLDVKLLILNHYKMSVEVLSMHLNDSYMFPGGSVEPLFQLLSSMACLKSLTLRGFIHAKCLSPDMFSNGWESLVCLDIGGLSIRYNTESADFQTPNPWQSFILQMLDCKAKSLKQLSLPHGVFHHSIISVFEAKFVSSKIESLKICEVCLCSVRKLDFLTTLHVMGLMAEQRVILRTECLLRGLQYRSLFDWIGDTPQFLGIVNLNLEKINYDERNLTLKLVKACQNLKSLTLCSVCDTPSQLSSILLQSPPLKSLSIYRTPCLKSKHLDLLPIYQTDLEFLDIRNNVLTDGILQHYRDSIQPQMPKLKLVCDWGCWNIGGGQPWPRQSVQSAGGSKSVKRESSELTPSLSLDDRAKIRMMMDSIYDYEEDD